MTFRAKPVVKRSQRGHWSEESRRNLYLNIGFGLVVVLAVVILGGAFAATYYGEHFSPVASVGGVGVTRDDLRDRIGIDGFRLSRTIGEIREQARAGQLPEAEAEQRIALLQQQQQQLGQGLSLEELIDGEVRRQLAAELGVTVTDEDIAARLVEEATRVETRHAWVIATRPEVSVGATEPTVEQKAAAKAAAEAALAEVQGGKTFEEVARTVSKDPSATKGGDLGFIRADDESFDAPFHAALFALSGSGLTAVVEGDDGLFRVGRVTEIVPERIDPTYEQAITEAGIELDAYRAVVRDGIIRRKLEDRLLAEVVDAPSTQRQVREIFIQKAAEGSEGDQVKVRHILYSPNDDPAAARDVPPEDPAWAEAEQAARAAHAQLAAGEAEFAELAKASDDTVSGADGGDLPYYARDSLDRAFGDAIFVPGLTKDQLLEPVRSDFGWHVIQFIDRRPQPFDRIQNAQLEVNRAGADFAAIAKAQSEGDTAADGGALGWVARYQLEPTLEDAIFATPVGEVSDIVETDVGYHLFLIEAEETRAPDEDQAETIRDSAFANWYEAEKARFDIRRDEDGDGALDEPSPSPSPSPTPSPASPDPSPSAS